jgi:hypothetical protein
MINFTDGQINIGEKNILTTSEDDLKFLAKEGIIESREDAVRTYYYVENQAASFRFGIFISLRKKKIDWVRMQWLDSPVKGWDDVSDKAMMDEYRMLTSFMEREVGRQPDNKGNRKSTWRFNWGKIEVTYEPRAYQADIFMEPWRDRL